MNAGRYVIVTPARNEQENLPHTIAAMAQQSRLPERWVIVNDGSSDRTREIIDAATREHSWIRAVHRPDRGKRKQGGGVVEAFNDGFKLIEPGSWDFLVKLDADLSFDSEYFPSCIREFELDPKLGIGGGLICKVEEGKLVAESPGDPAFHVRGATKIYRRECWDALGGLFQAPGWDTIDELKANMLGWTTRTFPHLHLRHYRFTGTADGTWRNYVKFGLANYITGYHPLFMFVKCVRRLLSRPYGIGGVALWWGFCSGYLKHSQRVPDPQLIQYVRGQQLNKLRLRPSLW